MNTTTKTYKLYRKGYSAAISTEGDKSFNRISVCDEFTTDIPAQLLTVVKLYVEDRLAIQDGTLNVLAVFQVSGSANYPTKNSGPVRHVSVLTGDTEYRWAVSGNFAAVDVRVWDAYNVTTPKPETCAVCGETVDPYQKYFRYEACTAYKGLDGKWRHCDCADAESTSRRLESEAKDAAYLAALAS